MKHGFAISLFMMAASGFMAGFEQPWPLAAVIVAFLAGIIQARAR